MLDFWKNWALSLSHLQSLAWDCQSKEDQQHKNGRTINQSRPTADPEVIVNGIAHKSKLYIQQRKSVAIHVYIYTYIYMYVYDSVEIFLIDLVIVCYLK